MQLLANCLIMDLENLTDVVFRSVNSTRTFEDNRRRVFLKVQLPFL